VSSRLRDERVVREKFQAACDPILEVMYVAYFRVGLGFRVRKFRHAIVANSTEMS
jgi:hypothetical protein